MVNAAVDVYGRMQTDFGGVILSEGHDSPSPAEWETNIASMCNGAVTIHSKSLNGSYVAVRVRYFAEHPDGLEEWDDRDGAAAEFGFNPVVPPFLEVPLDGREVDAPLAALGIPAGPKVVRVARMGEESSSTSETPAETPVDEIPEQFLIDMWDVPEPVSGVLRHSG